jgi:uncharacterized protein (TIGR02246 family)
MPLAAKFCRAIAAATLSIFLLTSASTAQAAEDRQADRAQINKILQGWENAWNTHDMKSFAALFRDDAIWVLWTGDVWVGRPKIEAGMTDVHNTVYRTSIQRERLEELTFVGPDSVVVRFESTLTGDTRYPDRSVHSRKFLVLTRTAGQWKIGWGQNTRFIKDLQPPAGRMRR